MVEPRTLVLFGASGDLTRGMMMPAMFNVMRQGLLSRECRVIGYARTPLSDEELRERTCLRRR